MVVQVDVHYIIKPKTELTEALDGNNKEFYCHKHLWQNQEVMREDRTVHPAYSADFVKVVFMLRLLQLNRIDRLNSSLVKLLGTPPKFGVTEFDKWWTIEEIKMHSSTRGVLTYTKDEEIDLLDGTGHEDTVRAIKYRIKDIRGDNDRY